MGKNGFISGRISGPGTHGFQGKLAFAGLEGAALHPSSRNMGLDMDWNGIMIRLILV